MDRDICGECNELNCVCWVNNEQKQELILKYTPVRAPPLVPVLMSQYALNSLGSKFLRIGLNASDGKFKVLLQVTYATGRGVSLRLDELQSIFDRKTWNWIINAFVNHKIMQGQTLAIPCVTKNYSIHQLYVSSDETVDIGLVPYDVIDGPTPCWTKPLKNEYKVSLNESEWKILREYNGFIPSRIEVMHEVSKECKKFYIRWCEHACSTIKKNPDFVMESKKSEKVSMSTIQQQLTTSCLTSMYPQFLESESYYVKCMMDELKTFHLRSLAYSVRECLVDDPKCTVSKCYCVQHHPK